MSKHKMGCAIWVCGPTMRYSAGVESFDPTGICYEVCDEHGDRHDPPIFRRPPPNCYIEMGALEYEQDEAFPVPKDIFDGIAGLGADIMEGMRSAINAQSGIVVPVSGSGAPIAGKLN